MKIIFPDTTLPGFVQLNLNGEGVSLPSQPTIMKLIRYQLKIELAHTGGIFYKDSYGKYSHMKITVGVVDKDNHVAKNINIPLAISLRYKNNDSDIISREPLLNTFGLVHTLQQGYALIPVRIEDVSSNHQNQDFAFYIGPLDTERYADVQGATSTAIHVKAKLRPLDPALTPPKFKLATFRDELAILRGGSSDSFYDAIEGNYLHYLKMHYLIMHLLLHYLKIHSPILSQLCINHPQLIPRKCLGRRVLPQSPPPSPPRLHKRFQHH